MNLHETEVTEMASGSHSAQMCANSLHTYNFIKHICCQNMQQTTPAIAASPHLMFGLQL